ncbi:hypothetical protein C8E00_10149 [Chromohalobacter marismortui]|uniref:Serine aminopeptidase S33 family n=1 Tax=Chromohalobacter marismortui TaxID=42055 RepID=A0A4R7NV87_9GAMM|nr:hypothetical protein C8E00_10149 [Chromohalobacter marismortui]
MLLHGSTADCLSMHSLAQAFASAGYTTYALDIRRHGASGTNDDMAVEQMPGTDHISLILDPDAIDATVAPTQKR